MVLFYYKTLNSSRRYDAHYAKLRLIKMMSARWEVDVESESNSNHPAPAASESQSRIETLPTEANLNGVLDKENFDEIEQQPSTGLNHEFSDNAFESDWYWPARTAIGRLRLKLTNWVKESNSWTSRAGAGCICKWKCPRYPQHRKRRKLWQANRWNPSSWFRLWRSREMAYNAWLQNPKRTCRKRFWAEK